MTADRKITKTVSVGNKLLGGGHDVLIQSMLNTSSHDLEACVKQARQLEQAGCEIVRVTIPDQEAVAVIPKLKEAVSIPIVADIHFDYRLAIESAYAGIDKIRINPGNIGDEDRVRQVAQACREKKIPIRIGVNSGSLEKHILEKYQKPTAEALCESAFYHISLLNRWDFDDIVVSIKSSNVDTMIQAYRRMSRLCDYPLHLGVTEAGTERMGLIKSSVGIGSLLLDGIGDTIRVSLTADPVKEIEAAKDILKAIGLSKGGVEIISCPTCGRTRVDLISLAHQVENALKGCEKRLTVAVMGCAVNGPGEAREADIGVACGDGCGLLFRKGTVIKKVDESEIVNALLREIGEI